MQIKAVCFACVAGSLHYSPGLVDRLEAFLDSGADADPVDAASVVTPLDAPTADGEQVIPTDVSSEPAATTFRTATLRYIDRASKWVDQLLNAGEDNVVDHMTAVDAIVEVHLLDPKSQPSTLAVDAAKASTSSAMLSSDEVLPVPLVDPMTQPSTLDVLASQNAASATLQPNGLQDDDLQLGDLNMAAVGLIPEDDEDDSSSGGSVLLEIQMALITSQMALWLAAAVLTMLALAQVLVLALWIGLLAWSRLRRSREQSSSSRHACTCTSSDSCHVSPDQVYKYGIVDAKTEALL